MFASLPPLAQLRAFAALVEEGTMSGAGRALNVSHAAVSQQVRALEARLGVILTVRDGRGVALTEAGRRLGAVLREGFGSIAREIEALTGADADRPLQITCTPGFAARWLLPRLAGFHAAHPDINLMLNPTAARADPEPGGIDLAIRYGNGDWPGLEASMLLQTGIVLAAATRLVGDRTFASPADLTAYPWLQEIGTNEAQMWLEAQGVAARPRRMTQMPGNLLQDALRAGDGVAATVRAFVEEEVARGDMRILFEDPDRGAGYFLLTRPGPMRPSLKDFVRWLRREAKAG